MPFIPEPPPNLQEVFALSTHQHMLDKLFWEVSLFKGSLDDPGLFGYRNSGFAAFKLRCNRRALCRLGMVCRWT
jgi:hypothetical protein